VQGSTSFLKKRSKKLSSIGVRHAFRGEAMGKVFLLLFFQKKKRFRPTPPSSRATPKTA
jgi:hypothetical protein